MKEEDLSRPYEQFFVRDERGRTPLFHAAEKGDLQAVREMIFSLTGTGFAPQRLALLEIRDGEGLDAADVAERSGHKEIADLLRLEAARMNLCE